MPAKKNPENKFLTAADIAKKLQRYFKIVDENLINHLEHELIKISLVSIRKYPRYIRAKNINSKDTLKIQTDVNQYRQQAIDILKRRLKNDDSYMATFRKTSPDKFL